jgi:moderate conductance mechanosensitive channel
MVATIASSVSDWFALHGIPTMIVIGVAIAVSFLGGLWVRGLRRRVEHASNVRQELAAQRGATLAHGLTNAVRIAVWSVAVLVVLDQLGLSLAPFLASAGVAGVALGFGAQRLVQDFLAGVFILAENQYDLGDRVTVFTSGQRIDGSVNAISIRRTELTQDDGTVAIVPHGQVVYVTNRSRGLGRISVGVTVRPDRVTDVRSALEAELTQLRSDREVLRRAYVGPRIARVESRDHDVVRLEVTAETPPDRRDEVERIIRARIEKGLKPVGSDATLDEPPGAKAS